MKHKMFWTAVLCMQLIGAACAPFADVHSHPLARLGALLLLLPGSLVASGIFYQDGMDAIWAGMAIVCNLAFWLAVSGMLARRKPKTSPTRTRFFRF